MAFNSLSKFGTVKEFTKSGIGPKKVPETVEGRRDHLIKAIENQIEYAEGKKDLPKRDGKPMTNHLWFHDTAGGVSVALKDGTKLISDWHPKAKGGKVEIEGASMKQVPSILKEIKKEVQGGAVDKQLERGIQERKKKAEERAAKK